MGTMLAGTTVLVADDDPDSVDLLAYLIREEGGAVRGAKTAGEALELLRTWTPDVLLLDITMPDADGFELLATIRGVARLREVPAVAVTARAYESDRARCIEAGFAEHVPKPYEPETLLAIIAQLGSKKASATVVAARSLDAAPFKAVGSGK